MTCDGNCFARERELREALMAVEPKESGLRLLTEEHVQKLGDYRREAHNLRQKVFALNEEAAVAGILVAQTNKVAVAHAATIEDLRIQLNAASTGLANLEKDAKKYHVEKVDGEIENARLRVCLQEIIDNAIALRQQAHDGNHAGTQSRADAIRSTARKALDHAYGYVRPGDPEKTLDREIKRLSEGLRDIERAANVVACGLGPLDTPRVYEKDEKLRERLAYHEGRRAYAEVVKKKTMDIILPKK